MQISCVSEAPALQPSASQENPVTSLTLHKYNRGMVMELTFEVYAPRSVD